MLKKADKTVFWSLVLSLLALFGVVVAGSMVHAQLQLIRERVVLWPSAEYFISAEIVEQSKGMGVWPTLHIRNHGSITATFSLSLLEEDDSIRLTQGSLQPGESAYFTLSGDSRGAIEESSRQSLVLQASSGKRNMCTWFNVAGFDTLVATKWSD